MRKTERRSDQFILPDDVIEQAKMDMMRGVKVTIDPQELVRRMKHADDALNGDSNDAEHDALYALRAWLSEILEDPDRRIVNARR